MGKIWHEEGLPEIEVGNLIKRTRTFDPDDTTFRTEDEIKERLQELNEKRASFDPKTQFCGLRRIGSSYTVAEPFAFFDGPTPNPPKLNYHLGYLAFGMVGLVGFMMDYKVRHGSYLTGLARGLIAAPVFAYLGSKFYAYHISYQKRKMDILFHYALMKENELPRIGMLCE